MDYYKVLFDVETFDFWAGAAAKVETMTLDELNALGEDIEAAFYDTTPTETDINDYVWFEWNEEDEDEDEDDL